MKHRLNFTFIGAATFLCALIFTGCEQQSMKENKLTTNNPVSVRGDCDECPDMDDCCCYVELDDDDEATLHLCGTSDGLSACTGNDCMAMWTGGGQFITLNSTNTRQVFCVVDGNVFWIENFSMSDPASIKVSCQLGSGLPQEIELDLVAQARQYIQGLTSCEIEICP